MKHRAYLSLGSNIEPEKNLAAAVRRLAERGTVARVSSVWESEPYGFADQPPFLNAALILHTDLPPAALKESLLRIEGELGRVRGENRYGPRTIDIDIVLYDREITTVGSGRIPDPELVDRPFLAVPLAEIAPRYRHPETGETLAAIAVRCGPDGGKLRRRDDVRLGS